MTAASSPPAPSGTPKSPLPDSGGHFVRGLALGAGVRVLAVEATRAADETRRRHGLGPRAAGIAAEGIVAAQLMSAHIKGEERITLQVQGERPRFALLVDVFSDGDVRARLTPATLPRTGPLDGVLYVIKHDARRELYRGAAPLDHATFEQALQGYLVQSQQTTGRIRVHHRVREGRVVAAAGLLVEKMPDMETSLFEELFGDLKDASLDHLMAGVAQEHLRGLPLDILEQRSVRFRCPCNRDRSRAILAGLGPEELDALHDEQETTELTCNFCGEIYRFTRKEVQAIRESL